MSRCDGKCSIPSVEIGQVWSYCRDNLKGTTPLAQAQIECLQRDYLPPAKAHIKRLRKQRPLVLLRPRPSPRNPVGDANTRGYNHAHGLGQASKLRNLRAAYGQEDVLAPKATPKPVAFDYTRNATVPKDERVYDAAYYTQLGEQQAREFARLKEEARRHG